MAFQTPTAGTDTDIYKGSFFPQTIKGLLKLRMIVLQSLLL